MDDYQTHTIVERDNLIVSIAKLRGFLAGPTTLELHDDEHERMWLQLGLMTGLERVLTERITCWAVQPQRVTHVAARSGEPERFIRIT